MKQKILCYLLTFEPHTFHECIQSAIYDIILLIVVWTIKFWSLLSSRHVHPLACNLLQNLDTRYLSQ